MKTRLLNFSLGMLAALSAMAGPSVSEWTPLFRGIDHATGTNDAAAYGTLSVNALRIDLRDPEIRLFATPPITNNFVPEVRETVLQKPKEFLRQYGLQVAVNGIQFSPSSYNDTSGTPARVIGLLVTTGAVVSAQTQAATNDCLSAMLFTASNEPRFVYINWPPTNTDGIHTAIGGLYPVLYNGVNVGSNYLAAPGTIHDNQPRTALGLSQDQRYLFMITLDGRGAAGNGALDWETADFLLRFGAYHGINLDGGGSTCMVKADSCGNAVEMNQNSYQFAVGRPGDQRSIGCNFGVYALSLDNIINFTKVDPGKTIAVVNWMTTEPASSMVEHGPSPALGYSASDPALVTNHVVVLTGLAPGTTNYYRVISATTNGQQYERPVCSFLTTTNPPPPTSNLTFTPVFSLTNGWRFTSSNLDGLAWQSRTYDDSSWSGPSPALFYVENNSLVGPRNTPLPANPASPNGIPFVTYYFRTRFTLTNDPTGLMLTFSNCLDDGAVYYLNGAELYRAYMPAAPTPIYNSTVASGYPCSTGDATCSFVFNVVPGVRLQTGENLLAVEAHNYNVTSPDLVFGCSLAYAAAPPVPTNTLVVTSSNPSFGIPVEVTPADGYLAQGGSTPFERSFGSGITVTLTAPASSATGVFQKWLLDGSDHSTSDTIQVTVASDHIVTAVYGNPSPPPLEIMRFGDSVVISWPQTGFLLQEAPTPLGDWQDITGTDSTNQVNITTGDPSRFYRLRVP